MRLLHELIQSMTSSEKGYFKKQASSQTAKVYVKLFDAIAGMEVYDEKKLVLKFKDAPFLKHLARTQNYLYHTLVRSLLLYHEESSPRIAINKLLNEAEMLTSRGLLMHARKRIDKAKEMAKNGEWFAELLGVLNHQGKLCDFNIYTPREQENMDVMAEIEMLFPKMNNFYDLVKLNRKQERISDPSMLLRKSELREKLLAVQAHPLLQREASSLSIKGKLLFNYVNYFNRLVLQDYHGALMYAKRYVALIIASAKFKVQNPEMVLEGYNMVLICLQFVQQPAALEKYLNKLKNVEIKNSWLEIRRFQYYSSCALWFYHENNRKKDFLQVAESTKIKLDLFKYGIKTDLKLGIYLALVEGYIKFGRYSDALEIIELYRQRPPKKIRHDYQNYLLFFQLIAHYETGNHKLVGNLLAVISRFIKRSKEFNEIENLMLKVFSACISLPDKRTRNQTLLELYAKIEKAAADSGGGQWTNYVIMIKPFCEARLKGARYHECVW